MPCLSGAVPQTAIFPFGHTQAANQMILVSYVLQIVTTRPPVLDTPTPTATTEGEQAVEPPGASLPPPIVIIEKRPLWIDLVIAGWAEHLSHVPVCAPFCFRRAVHQSFCERKPALLRKKTVCYAGGVLLVVFLLAVCFFFCFMRTGNKTNEQQVTPPIWYQPLHKPGRMQREANISCASTTGR